MNSFNQFQQTGCGGGGTSGGCGQTGQGLGAVFYGQQVNPSNQQQSQQGPQQTSSSTATNSSLAAMQFATQSPNFVPFGTQLPQSYTLNAQHLQKEIEALKKHNAELQSEIEKFRALYTDANYQSMSGQMKLSTLQEQLEVIHKEKLEQERAYKELKAKYDEKFALFKTPHQTDERSLFCDECNFEVKSQVALFIHKLNHHVESSIPRHLQLSTRSFSTMPDDSIRFKYKCYCCEIDSARDFARHEIYVHIYQFHTFDVPFKCKFCFLYFTSQSYLNDHLVEKHSGPVKGQAKGKRSNNKNSNPVGNSNQQQPQARCCDQINSTLQLNHSRTSSETNLPPPKRSKVTHQQQQPNPSDHQSGDINQLFQQLVGDSEHHQQLQQHQQQQQNSHHLQDQLNTMHQSSSSSSICTGGNHCTAGKVTSPRKAPGTTAALKQEMTSAQNNENLAAIMSDLDGDDSNLNCKYPGCKFVATTKNHLKFHISAHLMSKYKCPYCTFVGNRIVEIKRHILKSSKHSDQHVFLCPGCDFASDCEKTFRDHYTRYHNANVDISAVIEALFMNDSNKSMFTGSAKG